MNVLRLGTRGSALALAQARWVAERLPGEVELVTVTTAGDLATASAAGSGPVAGDPGDKSRWTGALEAALLAGEIDLAVHSAKDVPGELADGCALVAAPPREDPRDVVVGTLRPGARVGTSSLRRRAQLLAFEPALDVVDLRGNVDTRLRKLGDGEVDALVLAAAGLRRLGASVASEPLEGLHFVPAPGQGILALEARAGDDAALAAAGAVQDEDAFACLEAERAAVRVLGATCHTPVGVHAERRNGSFLLRGFAGRADGSAWVLDEVVAESGAVLAERMLAAGAAELLA